MLLSNIIRNIFGEKLGGFQGNVGMLEATPDLEATPGFPPQISLSNIIRNIFGEKLGSFQGNVGILEATPDF